MQLIESFQATVLVSTMINLILVFTTTLDSAIASAVPQMSTAQSSVSQSFVILTHTAPFANATIPSSNRALGTTACSLSCLRDLVKIKSMTWSPQTITATVTAETIVFVVNKQLNSTRSLTITNTEVDLTNYTRISNTNSAGTQTQLLTLTTSNSVTTHTVTFPTNYYDDYPASYTICGTLPTTISGAATCIKHPCVPHGGESYSSFMDPGAPAFAFPSHPPVSQTSTQVVDFAPDLKGLTYVPVWGTGQDFDEQVEPLFPDLNYWNCTPDQIMDSPDVVLNTALYLTATSTSTEADQNTATGRQQKTLTSGDSMLTSRTRIISEAATVAVQTSNSHVPSSITAKVSISLPSPHPAGKASFFLQAPSSSAISSNAAGEIADSASGAVLVPGENSVVAVSSAVIAPVEATFTSNHEQGPVISSAEKSPVVVTPPTTMQQSPALATSSFPPSPQPSSEATPIVLNSQTISTDFNAHLLISGITLSPGVPVALNAEQTSTPIILLTSSSHTILQVGSSYTTLPPAPSASMPSPNADAQTIAITSGNPDYTVGNQPLLTNSQGQFVIGSQTLEPGNAISVSGTPVSLASDASQLVVGSSTETMDAQTTVITSEIQGFSFENQPLTTNSQGQYMIGSQTLQPGDAITVPGTPISLAPDAGQLVVGSSTESLGEHAVSGLDAQTRAINTQIQDLSLGSQPLTTNSQGQYLIGSQTLSPGNAITVSGTPISLAPNASQLVVGSSTEGLGRHIMSGLGGGPTATSSSSGGFVSKGAAERGWSMSVWGIGSVMVGILCLQWWC